MMEGLLGIGRPRATQLDAALRMWGTPTGSRDELLDDQAEKLRVLLRFAASQIPYYRRLFESAGVDAASVRTAADLGRIPISSKLILREQPREDLMPPGSDPDKLFGDRSSGSTGIKLFLWREPFERHLLQLYRMRAWRLMGVRLTDHLARIGAVWPHWVQPVASISRLRQAFRIFHLTKVSSTQSPERVLADLIACRPDILTGYASVICEAARLAALRGDKRLRPRLVIPGGETLIPTMRQVIEESLETRVLDLYGAMEFNLLAWECSQTGLYHVNEDALVLEVVRDGIEVAEGETGEVLATSLHSYTFPLIRYPLGDLAVRGPAPCPCGAPFATLQRIQGRTVDYYYRADGSAIHHWEMSVNLNQEIAGSVGRYQIVQEEDGRIIYRLMPLGEVDREQIEALYRVGRRLLGEETPFEVRIEDEIPCAPSGKMLQSVNRIRTSAGRDSWDPADHDWGWSGS